MKVLKNIMSFITSSPPLLHTDDDDCDDDDTEEFGSRDGNRFGLLGSAGHDSSSSDEEESVDESVENYDDYISIDGSGDTYEEASDDEESDDDDDDNPFLGMPHDFLRMFGPHGPRARPPPPSDPQSSNIRPDNDAEESDDEIDSSAARCAACFRVGNQNHKWRRLGKSAKVHDQMI
jgi:hypothetical protein